MTTLRLQVLLNIAELLSSPAELKNLIALKLKRGDGM